MLAILFWLAATANDWGGAFQALGAEQFRQREAAQQRLLLAGRLWENVPFHRALHAALESPDPEIRRRAVEVKRAVLVAQPELVPVMPRDLPR